MSALTPPLETEIAAPPLPVYRFTPEQFRRLKDAGIVAPAEAIDYADGLLVLTGPEALAAPRIAVGSYPEETTPASEPLPLRRFSRDEVHRMMDAEVLIEGAPVELLEGWLVRKMTFHPIHNALVAWLHHFLTRHTPPGWHCRCQMTLATPESEPEPDISIVRGEFFDYRGRHPEPTDTVLAIEVADSSLRIDRAVKAPLYGGLGIPEYWIVNVNEAQIEVYTAPTGAAPIPGYDDRRDYVRGDEAPLVIAGQHLARLPITDLFPASV